MASFLALLLYFFPTTQKTFYLALIASLRGISALTVWGRPLRSSSPTFHAGSTSMPSVPSGQYISTAPLHNLLSKHLFCVQKGKGRKQKSPPPWLESDDLLLFKDCSNLPADNGERLVWGPLEIPECRQLLVSPVVRAWPV